MHETRIYKKGDYLFLVFDPLPGKTRRHRIQVPITEKGFRVLVKILSDRERSPFTEQAKIAYIEAPIQHMVDEYLKKGGQVKTPKQDAKETLSFEDLEL